MGFLAVQMKQPTAGLPYFVAALNADPARRQYWLNYIDALLQAGQVEDARQVLALARQHGLQGDEVEALAVRLEGGAQVAAQPNAESQHKQFNEQSGLKESPSASLVVLQNSKTPTKAKPAKPDKSARKSAPHQGENPSPQEIDTLVALFTEGRFTEAATLAQSMTVRFPQHEFGWKALGAVFKQMGRIADALLPMQKAAALSPDDFATHYNLGNTLKELGRLEEAEASYRRALQIKPYLEEAQSNLGNLLKDMGRLDEAEASYRRVLQIKPEYAGAHSNLGNLLKDMGRLDEAEASLRRALEIKPDLAEAHSNLGNTLKDVGRMDEAEASFRRALQIKPDFAEAHYNLGNTLYDLHRLGEAEISYRRALQIKLNYAEAHNNLGLTLHSLDRLGEAEASYQRALQIKPDFAEAHSNLGITLMQMGCLVEAEASHRRALEIAPDYAPAHQNLASILAYLSDFDQVVTESDVALHLKPDDAMGWEQRLYTYSYHPDLSAQEIYAEFVRWGDRFPDPVVDFSAHDRSQGRRLRIGYVSPDFRRHTSRFFFWPLFANHDHAVVELYAYSNVKVEDEFTAEFKGHFDHWRNIREVEDSEVARMIRQDGIDILVDCCNHMRDDRLGVFTLKPAPIQATWLGAAWTTGLKMIDYALIDPYMAPEGTLTRETIVRLPHCFVAYRPPEETAEIATPPCLKNGYITFGYTGRTERLNHHTFRVWGEILRQNPTARLILDFRPFADLPTQAHYRQFMLRHGMDPGRVTMRNSANIFAGLNDIDILLDSFPHSGGTMLFDALWMGVPILTLAGRPPVGRIGTSLMINLGLPEWVAESQEEYIGKAGTLAKNAETLAQLRAGMRERMQNSPIMDGSGFARGVEAAYREMFEKWARPNAEMNQETDVCMSTGR